MNAPSVLGVCFMVVTAGAALGASPTSAARMALCQRGSYSIEATPNRMNLMTARVTLPTTGYTTQIRQSGDKYRFECARTSAISLDVLTGYTTYLPVPVDKVTLIDASGEIVVAIKSPTPIERLVSKKKCDANNACSTNEFCDTTPSCSGDGLCVVRPQFCTDVYDPVEACDGKTYGNRCVAASKGVSVKGRSPFAEIFSR
jgi:hypothetical protein